MLKDKLTAIPSIPYLFTKIEENNTSIIRVKTEIAVFIFIIPTAESKLPYRFLSNILSAKPASKMAKTNELSSYLVLKNKAKISVLKVIPKSRIPSTMGMNIL